MIDASANSIAELEANLARTREAMTTTVDQLADKLNPKTQMESMKDDAKAKAGEVLETARATAAKALNVAINTVDRAAKGDTTARNIVYGTVAAAGLLALGGIVKIFRR